jgi:xanthine dehydrogenase molybdopterin-binding subunit B
MWHEVKDVAGYEARRVAVEEFNMQQQLRKRGLALVPAR